MSNHQERDAWIRERQEAGTSLKEIAVACGMSVKAVQHVLRKLQADGVEFEEARSCSRSFAEPMTWTESGRWRKC